MSHRVNGSLQNSQGGFRARLLLFVFAPFLCCGLSIWLPQLLNNWQLAQFADNLFRYPLPPQTKILNRHSEVGLMGNGNHCDFLVTQTMSTKLTHEEIRTYYRNVTFPPVNNHNEGMSPKYQGQPIPVYLEFDNESREIGHLQFTIKLIDGGYDPGFDIRCH